MQDHDKTFQRVLVKEGFREFRSARFLLHAFTGLFEPLLRAVSCVYVSVYGVCVCLRMCVRNEAFFLGWREGYSLSRKQFSGEKFSRGNFPGENFPWGSFRGTIFLGEIFWRVIFERIPLNTSFFTWSSIVRTQFFSQNVEALLHYSKLLNEFLPSLENVQDLLKHVPDDLKSKVETKLNNVIEGLTKSQDKMEQTIKVINLAQIVSEFFFYV